MDQAYSQYQTSKEDQTSYLVHYRILQVLRRLFGLFSANLRRIATEKMGLLLLPPSPVSLNSECLFKSNQDAL